MQRQCYWWPSSGRMRRRIMGRMTMDDETNGWKGRLDTTASRQNQGYYISKYIYSFFLAGLFRYLLTRFLCMCYCWVFKVWAEARQRLGQATFWEQIGPPPPPLRLPSAYKKRSGFDFWQFKTAEIIHNNKNHQKLYSVGSRFLVACKWYPPLPVGQSLFTSFSSRIWRIWRVKSVFWKFRWDFYVCVWGGGRRVFLNILESRIFLLWKY